MIVPSLKHIRYYACSSPSPSDCSKRAHTSGSFAQLAVKTLHELACRSAITAHICRFRCVQKHPSRPCLHLATSGCTMTSCRWLLHQSIKYAVAVATPRTPDRWGKMAPAPLSISVTCTKAYTPSIACDEPELQVSGAIGHVHTCTCVRCTNVTVPRQWPQGSADNLPSSLFHRQSVEHWLLPISHNKEIVHACIGGHVSLTASVCPKSSDLRVRVNIG